MAKKSHFFKGVAIGAVVGTVVALFVTPKKGSELRESAVNKYNDFKEDPQATLGDFKDFSVDKFNEVKSKFDSGEYSAEKAKDFLLEKRDVIKSKVESGDLSVDAVKDFFYKTKDSLTDRFSAETGEEADDGDLTADYSWTESDKDESNEW